MFTHTYPSLLLSLHSTQWFCSPLPHPSWNVSAICITQDTPLFRRFPFQSPPRRAPSSQDGGFSHPAAEPGLTLAMPGTPAGQMFSSSQVFPDPYHARSLPIHTGPLPAVPSLQASSGFHLLARGLTGLPSSWSLEPQPLEKG